MWRRVKQWFSSEHKAPTRPAQIFFTNTQSGTKEVFIPLKPGAALIYSCGPTAYGPIHIGNLRTALLSDIIARVLAGAGYRVRQVTNITDFGHLVSEGDEGEDKMTKGLKREGLELTLENMRAMAERYSKGFVDDLSDLNIDTERISFPRASDYIPEQIALIKTLEQKGYAYRTRHGVYFDTERFSGYGKLGGLTKTESKDSRIEQEDKRHPADFVLWKPDAKLGWQSPWGLGFPGWHIECSAMARSLLGQEIDIHTGGEDLRAIHHNNEIAQSEAASGRPFAHYWMHGAFLTAADGEKASKSLGNVVYLSELPERGYHPLTLRYFFLQAHYRTPLSFSWEALAAASAALQRLWKLAGDVAEASERSTLPSPVRLHLIAALRDDLGTPQALALLWEALKTDDYTPEEKWGLLEDAEAYLGLSLTNPPVVGRITESNVPDDLKNLLNEREVARDARDFARADDLRAEIGKRGYRVEDGPNGPVLTKDI